MVAHIPRFPRFLAFLGQDAGGSSRWELGEGLGSDPALALGSSWAAPALLALRALGWALQLTPLQPFPDLIILNMSPL